jgi:hypothetical protein
VSIAFGDDAGPDDQYDDSAPDLDPEAVTIRFHEERVLRGYVTMGFWHELAPDERDIALVIGRALTERIREDPDPQRVNAWLRGLIFYLSGRPAPHEFPVVEALIGALRAEGTLR